MKVTPVSRKFGKYAPGDVFTSPFSPKMTKVLIKLGKLEEAKEPAPSTPVYQTRMMQAATVDMKSGVVTFDEPPAAGTTTDAPYGYKADGTPRLRPGRPAKASDE